MAGEREMEKQQVRFLARVYNEKEKLLGYYVVNLQTREYVCIKSEDLVRLHQGYTFENVVYMPSHQTVRLKPRQQKLHILRGKINMLGNLELVNLGHDGITIVSNVNPSTLMQKRRYIYKELLNFINTNNIGKICALYGLRRTGKTVLLKQLLTDMNSSNINARLLTIKAGFNVTMQDLFNIIDKLAKEGVKVILIDEITFIDQYQNRCTALADYYAGQLGLKIVIAGTHSLGIYMSTFDLMYDRIKMIDTSYVSFKEYANLKENASLSRYLHGACNLCDEYSSYGKTHDYIETSIVSNIVKSLENAKYQKPYSSLLSIYNNGDLESLILKIIEGFSIEMTSNALNNLFSSNMLGSAVQIYNQKSNIDLPKQLVEDIASDFAYRLSLRLKPLEEIDTKKLSTIRVYLRRLGVINQDNSRLCPKHNQMMCIQWGLVGSCAEFLIQSIKAELTTNGTIDTKISADIMRSLSNKVMSDTNGKLLEQLILYETSLSLMSNKSITIDKYDNIGEIDMVVYDDSCCQLYEIKWSQERNKHQARWLLNNDVIQDVQKKYGTIKSRNIIYNGETKKEQYGDITIHYINATQYLLSL